MEKKISKVLTSENQMSFVSINMVKHCFFPRDNCVVRWVKWSKLTQMKLLHHLAPQCKL